MLDEQAAGQGSDADRVTVRIRWVEAAGEPVCETVDPRTIYTPMITI